jgi:hypothetical protein
MTAGSVRRVKCDCLHSPATGDVRHRIEGDAWEVGVLPEVQRRTMAISKEKTLHEVRDFAGIVFYLWLIFGLLVLYKSVILREEHIDFVARGLALINAFALGKVLLVLRTLNLGERLNSRPLIYPTLLKSALFTVVLACVKILEEVAIGLFRHESFQRSIAGLGGGTLQGIFVLTLLLFVVLIPFVGVTELQRVLGESKLEQMFFGVRQSVRRPKSAA